MASDKPIAQERGRIGVHGHQPVGGIAWPTAPGAGVVQRGYQPETAQQAPQPPNEGSGVQSPAKKE
jgi:hypothetical protein